MLASLKSAALFGIDALPVQVEVDVSFGLPSFNMVGLPDASVRESRDRVRTAIRNSGFEFPPHRITVNLAPADVRKGGSAFDLPIALGILAASGHSRRRVVDDWRLVGELSLDGSIQPTAGTLPVAVRTRKDGLTGLVLPRRNLAEASVVEGLHLVPVDMLGDALKALDDPVPLEATGAAFWNAEPDTDSEGDFADVRGQGVAKRALEIVAAGGHNVLLVGPPGSGKTMLARRLPAILPPLEFDEAIEATTIHSVAGLRPPGLGPLTSRPFRAPHHTISEAALVGGGPQPRPGEISLAHHGVLFLDEVAEFSRRVLDVLRQPLEEGCVRIARAARTAVFPARFTLVAAMNPCPCGFAGLDGRVCRCTTGQVAGYRARLSGPLLDRVDLQLHVPALAPDEVVAADGEAVAEPSAAIRRRVIAARLVQTHRAAEAGLPSRLNAGLGGRALRRHTRIDADGRRLLLAAVRRFHLSARAYDRLLRVARTIADLAGEPGVRTEHLAEALQYRLPW